MAVYRVSTVSQFDAALKSARGGDSILLNPGTYDQLYLTTSKSGFGHINFASKVTIAAADPGRPPVINDLRVNGAGNIEFKGVKFDWVPSKTATGPVFIQNSRKITLNDVEVEGQIVGRYGEGIGVRVRDSHDFTIMNSDLRDLKNGMNLTGIVNAQVTDNNFRGMSIDGMQVGGLKGAVISGNDFRSFNSNPDLKHKDAIQFVNGNGIAPSQDVLIVDNVIVNPEQSHSIFLGNRMAAKEGNLSAYYRNITIEDNYINSAQKHGITVEHGHNIKIRNNTITQNFDIFKDGKMVNTPIINVSASSVYVTITGNKVASVPDAANSTWTVSSNSTGTKNILHWESVIKPASASSLSAEPLPERTEVARTTEDFATVIGSVERQAGAETYRFNGKIAAADAEFFVRDVSFEEGDKIIFRSFEQGTFSDKRGGNRVEVFDGGASVKIDSALDIQEVVAMSKAMTATTTVADDALVIRIAQGKGTAELVFEDLGATFRAADQPDLF